MTDKQKLDEIVRLQDIFNAKLDNDWRQLNWDWDSCITVEIGEALESLQYKHWKKQELDLENVKVEAIDILHFHIAERLEMSARGTISKHLLRSLELDGTITFPKNDIEGVRLAFNNYNDSRTYKNLGIVFHYLGIDTPEVYKRYIIKNVLNTFRADNGYKEGTYIKMWNGVEDNKVALAIWKDDDTFGSIYSRLEAKYAEVKYNKE